MPQEPDVPLLVEETGVFLAIGGAILDGIADVALDDDGSVYGDTDVVAVADDFLGIPFPCGADRGLMIRVGREYAVDRTVVLERRDVAVDGMLAIEDLAFHPDVGRIAFHRRAKAYAVVRTRCQLEIEA